MTHTGPLHRRRIVVTRPAGRSDALEAGIRAAGGEPLVIPLLQLVALPPARDHAFVEPDWVIAVSPSAVALGHAWWPAERPWPPSGAVAGVGEGTARAWREAGHPSPLAPHGADSDALLADPALREVAGRRILILRGEGGRDLLGPTLRERGATVEEWLCYRREAPANLQADLSALRDAPPDAWTVTSSEAADHLAAAWSGPPPAAPVFAPHPRIAERLRTHGWHAVACETGDDGLLRALLAWFDSPHDAPR